MDPLIQTNLDFEEEYDKVTKEINEDGFEEETEDEVTSKKPYNLNNIDIMSAIKTVQQVYSRISYGEIELEPDFQREKVWNKKQKSRLIESLLLRIPLPTFYVYVKKDPTKKEISIDDDTWVVIDGLQRLSTLFDFCKDDGFLLEDLEYLTELDGKSFKDFKDNKEFRKYERIINETELLIYIVKPSTPKEVALNIFGRINTLGTPLSPQELRHALNLGKSTKLLKELTQLESFNNAVTEKSLKRMKRMSERELVLRLLAFKVLGFDKYERSIAKFLDETMDKINTFNDEEIKELKEYFDNSMKKSFLVFGEYSFRKILMNDTSRRPINKPLFETIGYYINNYSYEELTVKKEELFNAFSKKMSLDSDYYYSLSYSTNTPKVLKTRFDKTKEIFNEVMGK
jgi:hypothetical protein